MGLNELEFKNADRDRKVKCGMTKLEQFLFWRLHVLKAQETDEGVKK